LTKISGNEYIRGLVSKPTFPSCLAPYIRVISSEEKGHGRVDRQEIRTVTEKKRGSAKRRMMHAALDSDFLYEA
jgi:hypothetical protein